MMTEEEREKPYKKRVLFISEASFLNTGFSNYNRELLPKLVETDKYVIAEFGSYASQHDPRVKSFIQDRWKFYGNQPDTEEELNEFNQPDPAQPGQNTNQFGRWRFEKVVADFKPDAVISNRDAWMDSFIARSPLRKYFQWMWMVIPDSVPQREEWIQTYVTCDYIMAYSDFGIDALRKSSPHLEVRFNPPGVDLLGVNNFNSLEPSDIKKPGKLHPIPLRPGVDTEIFKPVDKKEVRAKWGLNPNNPVILIVQRNQARKRINEAIQAFALMKEKYGSKDPDNKNAVDRAVMVLHTAWPDNQHSSDYPRCIERTHRGYHGMPYSHKNIFAEILNTFLCNNPQCGHVFLGHAIHLRHINQQTGFAIKCPKCEQISAKPPNTSVGYTREQLAEVYNLGDILLQMSIAEGEGMPCNEAKACGVMVLATDYASLSEKTRIPSYEHIDKKTYTMHLGGAPLKVSYLYEEPETNQFRAHTSIEDAADKMAQYLLDAKLLLQMQSDARQSVIDNYDINNLVKRWEFILDKKKIMDRSNTWDRPAKLLEIDMSEPSLNMSDDQFVDWCYTNLLGYAPDAIDQKGKSDWLQTIEYHCTQGGKTKAAARQMVTNFFRQEAQNLNSIELMRTGEIYQHSQTETNKDTVGVTLLL
jgi:glycosyltransferase involved in cell wall biosynthesis